MPELAIRLNPRLLANPDADIRYSLPEVLAERSGGSIDGDGYDYVGPQPMMVVFLQAPQAEPALACILDVIENVPVCGSALGPGAVVAVQGEARWEVVWPSGFAEPFLPGRQDAEANDSSGR